MEDVGTSKPKVCKQGREVNGVAPKLNKTTSI